MLDTAVDARSTVVNKTKSFWWPPGYVNSMALWFLRSTMSQTGINIFPPALLLFSCFPFYELALHQPIAQFRN